MYILMHFEKPFKAFNQIETYQHQPQTTKIILTTKEYKKLVKKLNEFEINDKILSNFTKNWKMKLAFN